MLTDTLTMLSSLMISSPLMMIGAGFTLGLVHALDADHVMAITALSQRKKISVLNTLRYCLKWSLGHGAVLLLIGGLFFGLGFTLSPSLLNIAEAGVGVLLIVIGGFCLMRIRKQKLQLNLHQHGDVTHVHWHSKEHQASQASHTPTMVGMLHGLAGSAPALALVPLISHTESSGLQLSVACTYLLVFSFGVLLAMGLFGLGLAYAQQRIQTFNTRIFEWGQYAIALSAIFFGGFWLSQTL